MTHAKYKSTASNSSNLNQAADTTCQITIFIQQVILFRHLMLYCVSAVCYSLHEILLLSGHHKLKGQLKWLESNKE